MATTAAAVPGDGGASAEAGKGGRRKLIILLVPVALLLAGAGLWFVGILPPLLGLSGAAGHGEAEPKAVTAGHSKPAAEAGHGAKSAAKAVELATPPGPLFVELPDIVSNLNTAGKRAVYIKLRSRIELVRPGDEAILKATMPRVLDLFQTYLREMRPEEMRGSAGTYRLREELIARANIAVAPARIQDLLFTEILIQ